MDSAVNERDGEETTPEDTRQARIKQLLTVFPVIHQQIQTFPQEATPEHVEKMLCDELMDLFPDILALSKRNTQPTLGKLKDWEEYALRHDAKGMLELMRVCTRQQRKRAYEHEGIPENERFLPLDEAWSSYLERSSGSIQSLQELAWVLQQTRFCCPKSSSQKEKPKDTEVAKWVEGFKELVE